MRTRPNVVAVLLSTIDTAQQVGWRQREGSGGPFSPGPTMRRGLCTVLRYSACCIAAVFSQAGVDWWAGGYVYT